MVQTVLTYGATRSAFMVNSVLTLWCNPISLYGVTRSHFMVQSVLTLWCNLFSLYGAIRSHFMVQSVQTLWCNPFRLYGATRWCNVLQPVLTLWCNVLQPVLTLWCKHYSAKACMPYCQVPLHVGSSKQKKIVLFFFLLSDFIHCIPLSPAVNGATIAVIVLSVEILQVWGTKNGLPLAKKLSQKHAPGRFQTKMRQLCAQLDHKTCQGN